jgi:hypothetical protein
MCRKTLMVFDIKTCLYGLMTDTLDCYCELKTKYPELTVEFIQEIRCEMARKGRLKVNNNSDLRKYAK